MAAGFHHRALLYRDEDELLAGTVPFVRDGVAAGEPVMVAVRDDRARPIAAELGDEADAVEFVDMAELGRNPARIIPAWLRFASDAGGRPMRGVGEPIWPSRTAAEIGESERHEALLNVAFDDGTPLALVCPYDVARLPAGVVAAAERNHPRIGDGGEGRPSPAYAAADPLAAFAGALVEPEPAPPELAFGGDDLWAVRRFVAEGASDGGTDPNRAAELALVADELATNSVRYGGGGGTVRLWGDTAAIVCEVSDAGTISDPLAGRVRPAPTQEGGRGLWLVNQLCDLVQIRSSAAGTVARVRVNRPAP